EKLDGKSYVEEYIHAFVHEMKSPLSAIDGAAELLEGKMSEEERARFLANVRAECRRMREILDRLLELARLEQRQALEVREQVRVHALAEDLRSANEALLLAGSITFRNELALEVVVQGDPFLLRQALGNLLDNAIQFSPPGGVITLGSATVGGRVHL